MNFTGRLVFAFLEEDNTQRSLFRVRPFLTDAGAVSREDLENLGDEGCIRVVPDKKEQYTFKDRMRRLGGICVLNLRDNPKGRPKIRPNRNYAPSRGEHNRYIIYSDAVRALPVGMLCQVIPEGRASVSRTPFYYLRDGGRIQGPYQKEDGTPLGQLVQIAPDCAQLFAITAEEGQELLFYLPGEDREEDGGEARGELAPDAGFGNEKDGKKPEAVSLLHATPLALPPVHNPLHEVVDRQVREGRQEGASADPGQSVPAEDLPSPLERFRRELNTLWMDDETRERAARFLVGMPGADRLLCKVMIGESGSPLFAAMNYQLQEMEAERLELLLQIDRARRDERALSEKAVQEATAAAKGELLRLTDEIERTRAALRDLSEQRAALVAEQDRLVRELGSLDPQDPRFYPPMAVEARPESVAQRLAEELGRAGFQVSQSDAWNILIQLTLFPRVQICAAHPGDSLFAAETLCRALGAACARQAAAGRLPTLLRGGEAYAFLLSLTDGPVPEGCTRLILAVEWGPVEGDARDYDLDPWPSVRMEVKAGWARPEARAGEPVSALKLREHVQAAAQDLPPSVFSLLELGEKALEDQGIRLPLTLRASVFTYLLHAAPLLEGGVVTALDYAFRDWILPYAAFRGADLSMLKPHLCGLPRSVLLS